MTDTRQGGARLVIAEQGYFFVRSRYTDTADGRIMTVQRLPRRFP